MLKSLDDFRYDNTLESLDDFRYGDGIGRSTPRPNVQGFDGLEDL